MDTNIINWVALFLCLLLAFLLSGMEAGVFALSRLRVRRLARAGKPSAKLLHGFLEKPENFLWTILVGNTLANFLILGWTLLELHEWLLGHDVWIAAAFAAAVFLFYALFDLLPKMFFRAHPNQLCLMAAPVFRLVHVVLSPLVAIGRGRFPDGAAADGRTGVHGPAVWQPRGNALGHAGIRAIAHQRRARDDQPRARPAKFHRAADRHAARAGGDGGGADAAGRRVPAGRERRLWRLPVRETRDGAPRIAGLLSLGPLLFRDDLDLQKPAAAHMTPALFVNENMRLEVALRLMQRAGHRLAIVLARDGAEMGIVSLEDILKVMFGEMKL